MGNCRAQAQPIVFSAQPTGCQKDPYTVMEVKHSNNALSRVFSAPPTYQSGYATESYYLHASIKSVTSLRRYTINVRIGAEYKVIKFPTIIELNKTTRL